MHTGCDDATARQGEMHTPSQAQSGAPESEGLGSGLLGAVAGRPHFIPRKGSSERRKLLTEATQQGRG